MRKIRKWIEAMDEELEKTVMKLKDELSQIIDKYMQNSPIRDKWATELIIENRVHLALLKLHHESDLTVYYKYQKEIEGEKSEKNFHM